MREPVQQEGADNYQAALKFHEALAKEDRQPDQLFYDEQSQGGLKGSFVTSEGKVQVYYRCLMANSAVIDIHDNSYTVNCDAEVHHLRNVAVPAHTKVEVKLIPQPFEQAFVAISIWGKK